MNGSSRQSTRGKRRIFGVLLTVLAAVLLAVLAVCAINVFSKTPLNALSQSYQGSIQGGSECSELYLSRVVSLLRKALSTEELDSASPEAVIQLIHDNMQSYRQRLEAQQYALEDLERRNRQLMALLEDGGHAAGGKEVKAAVPLITPEIVRTFNIRQKSEFELIPYAAFTRDHLYQLEPGLTHRPEDTPRGNRKKEMAEVLNTAVQILNSGGRHHKSVSLDDFQDGIMRTSHVLGTQYDMYFSAEHDNVFKHLTLFRPFTGLQKIRVESVDKSNEWINIIMPLAGRVETFKQFIETFAAVCIQSDRRIYLTVVYFGTEDQAEVLAILNRVAGVHNYTDYKFIAKDNEEFSRGVGLFTGVEAWEKGNVLMLFCDVDIYFDKGFLNRCRMNAQPGRKVYYPMVFSLYNPDIVYRGKESPLWRDQLVIGKNTGYWRGFGFGMTCIYRSDFLYMKGFDTSIKGWGVEDVKLYRKIVASNLEVVRAPDRGIFHLYHPKHCDIALPKDQYVMCLGSKAISEASASQLGLLAFKELEKEHEKYHTAKGAKTVKGRRPSTQQHV